MNSFDLDEKCRANVRRIRIAPLPVYEPQRADFELPLWVMAFVLLGAIGLLAWRLPEILLIGSVV